jgi:hypothetical protein
MALRTVVSLVAPVRETFGRCLASLGRTSAQAPRTCAVRGARVQIKPR